MFRLKEILRWFGVTVFEILLFCLSITLYSVLLSFKLGGFMPNVSWYVIHSPLFVSDALIAYFCLIVFIRQYIERTYRVAIFRALWSFNQVMLIFLHKLLLCFKLEGQKGISTSEIFSPIFALLILLVIRACQLL